MSDGATLMRGGFGFDTTAEVVSDKTGRQLAGEADRRCAIHVGC